MTSVEDCKNIEKDEEDGKPVNLDCSNDLLEEENGISGEIGEEVKMKVENKESSKPDNPGNLLKEEVTRENLENTNVEDENGEPMKSYCSSVPVKEDASGEVILVTSKEVSLPNMCAVLLAATINFISLVERTLDPLC